MTDAQWVELLHDEVAKAGIDGSAQEEHVAADAMVIKFMRALGYEKLAAAYDKLSDGFWYA